MELFQLSLQNSHMKLVGPWLSTPAQKLWAHNLHLPVHWIQPSTDSMYVSLQYRHCVFSASSLAIPKRLLFSFLFWFATFATPFLCLVDCLYLGTFFTDGLLLCTSVLLGPLLVFLGLVHSIFNLIFGVHFYTDLKLWLQHEQLYAFFLWDDCRNCFDTCTCSLKLGEHTAEDCCRDATSSWDMCPEACMTQ